MNVYIILIGIVLVTLIAVFGHNPVEEARKAHDAQYSHDRLIGATEKYFKEQHTWGSAGGNGPAERNTGLSNGYSSSPYIMNSRPATNYPAPGAYGQAPARQDTGDYYPPPAPGEPPSPLQEQQEERQQEQNQQNQAEWP